MPKIVSIKGIGETFCAADEHLVVCSLLIAELLCLSAVDYAVSGIVGDVLDLGVDQVRCGRFYFSQVGVLGKKIIDALYGAREVDDPLAGCLEFFKRC